MRFYQTHHFVNRPKKRSPKYAPKTPKAEHREEATNLIRTHNPPKKDRTEGRSTAEAEYPTPFFAIRIHHLRVRLTPRLRAAPARCEQSRTTLIGASPAAAGDAAFVGFTST